MQLNKLVTFYKCMADPTRIRIVSLLADGPLHGKALAGKLGITPPTITHHMAKLRDTGLVYERRDKNTIYFHLNEKVLRQDAVAILKIVDNEKANEKEQNEMNIQERNKVINNFFAHDGKLKQIPAQRKKKLYVLEHMLRGIEAGRKYEEKEINEYIKQFHEDFATIRREFIMNNQMYRKDGIYELNPPEMWASIQNDQK